jgi:hypothetical protein
MDSYFETNVTDVTMNRLKEYYLDLLLHLDCNKWPMIYQYMISTQKRKYETTNITKTNGAGVLEKVGASASAGILLTTKDAYSLTDGPTIFLAEDVSKIGTFYIQQSNIAPTVFQSIMSKITTNSILIQKIEDLERNITAKETKTSGDDKTESAARESGRLCMESQKWMDEINKLRKEIKSISLDAMYIPNTRPHQQLWAPRGEIQEQAFVSNIGDDMTKTIMMLDIENHYKVLLLLGIGMFVENKCVAYMEIMKKLADEQRLFIIIASTDYIYGTNYAFCHGFIGKDLTRMTQQKTLQAMGRIGRNNVQQDYTIRFRDDSMIMQLFEKPKINQEAINMCALFSSGIPQ